MNVIYILEQYNIKVKLFADDVKMYLKIVNDVCMQQLQLAINALTNWTPHKNDSLVYRSINAVF